CPCGRPVCGPGGGPFKRQNCRTSKQILRQSRTKGLLQFCYLPPDVPDGAESGWRPVRLGDSRYLFGRHFDVDTSVRYSLSKQNRWELMEGFFIKYAESEEMLEGLQIFMIEENFSIQGNRLLAPGVSRCDCSLGWMPAVQSLLTQYRRSLKRLRADKIPPAASGTSRSQRRRAVRVTARQRQVQRQVAELTRATVDGVREEILDLDASCEVRLPVRFQPERSRLLNLYELLGVAPSAVESLSAGQQLPEPVSLPLSALASAPKLVLHSLMPPHELIIDDRWHRPLTRTFARARAAASPAAASVDADAADSAASCANRSSLGRQKQKRHRRKRMRRVARREAEDELADWLEDNWQRRLDLSTAQDAGGLRLSRRASSTLAEAAGISELLAKFASDELGFAEFSPSEGEPPTQRSSRADGSFEQPQLKEDNEEDREDDFRPVLTVQRELLNRLLEAGAGGGGRRSDSWPTKIWLRPWPSSMATSWRWPGPTLLMEELPAAGGKLPSASRAVRFGSTRVRLHLLGCGSPADRRHVLTRLLACQDPFGSLPALLARLSTPGQDQPIVDDESIDSTVSESDLSSGVRISALTCPPLYSWLYSSAPVPASDVISIESAGGRTSRTPRRLPPLLAGQRRDVEEFRRSQTSAACGSCGVRSPRPWLSDPADWVTALTACRHWHCAACWTRHVTRCVSEARSGAVACPSPGCGHPADPATVLWFAPPGLYYRCLRHAAWQPLLP
ncbi:hypothetical protein BOX15_Mlig000539g8, partial [Macrostomum lignano]